MKEERNEIISFINIFSENIENNIISKFTISKVNTKQNIISENIINLDNINNLDITNYTNNIVKINIIKNLINTININITECTGIKIKPFHSKVGLKVTFIFVYKTKEISKQLSIKEAKDNLLQLLGNFFLQADLFLIADSYHLLMKPNGKATLLHKKSKAQRAIESSHNKVKNHILTETPLPFLTALGVFSKEGKLKEDKREKFKQLNKYLEFFGQGIREAGLKDSINVVDMGSGKGYLTFAMYHYLVNILQTTTQVNGIEMRQDMVSLCNAIGTDVDFKGLRFTENTIQAFELEAKTDVLVALHACDTATDDALAKGIRHKVPLIIVAPCCHKQVRRDMVVSGELAVFEKFGIIKERFAETATDLIRSMILDAHGYETKIFEFIGADNTPKNMMITAVLKTFDKKKHAAKLKEIQAFKDKIGLRRHYLEEVMV